MDKNGIVILFAFFLILADATHSPAVLGFRKLAGGDQVDGTTRIAPAPVPAVDDKNLDPKPNDRKLDPNSNDKNLHSKPNDEKLDPKPNDKNLDAKPNDEKLDPKPNDKNLDAKPHGPTHEPAENKSGDPSAPSNSTELQPGKFNDPHSISNSTEVDPQGSNVTLSVGSPIVNQTGKEIREEAKGKAQPTDSNNSSVPTIPPAGNQPDFKENNKKPKKDKEADSQVGSCSGVDNSCSDENALTACVQSFSVVSKELVALVQNHGESTMKVSIIVPNSKENKEIVIREHQAKMINVFLGESTRLVLNGGSGNCTLNMGPQVSAGNYFLNLPSYDKLLTPINVAYLLIITVLILGGTWACSMFRKRRRHDGVSYQELEMGLPEPISAMDGDTAEGWDQGWDDDWDDDKAVRSPGGHISVNGLSSRTSNRDGWENGWEG